MIWTKKWTKMNIGCGSMGKKRKRNIVCFFTASIKDEINGVGR